MRIAPPSSSDQPARAKLETYARGRSTRPGCAARPDCVAGRRSKQDLKIAHCFRSCRALLLAGARVFCMTVSRGWSTTLRDLAARLPSHRNSAYGDCQDDTGKTFSCNPLEHSHYAAVAGISEACTAHLAQSRSEAARVETFKLSTIPFRRELEDIVGLYAESARACARAVIDEKSQIQALDRTQPGLPMKKGRAHTMTHDYKRHGTTTLVCRSQTPSRPV